MDVILPLVAYDRRMLMVLERRLIRDITNPFDVSRTEFCSSYRLPQYLARDLIREIEPHAQHIPQGILLHLQVLCALNFYAGGAIKEELIEMRTTDEIEKAKNGFYRRYKIPGILGLVDCTHVPLTALKNEIEIPYINRKNFHSLNVQIIATVNHLIYNVDARYPGSVHDAVIWGNSKVLKSLRAAIQ